MAWTEYNGSPVNWTEREDGGVVNFQLPGEDYSRLPLQERLKRQAEYLRIVDSQSAHPRLPRR